MKFTLNFRDAKRLNRHPCFCNDRGYLWRVLVYELDWGKGCAYLATKQHLVLVECCSSRLYFEYIK